MANDLEMPGQEPQEPAEPSLRETLEQVIESTPAEDTPAPIPVRETPEQAQTRAQRERDNRGRFAPKTSPAGAEVPSEDEVRAASDPLPVQESAPTIDHAPKSWKAGMRDKWSTLDPEVRAEVHRRERETTKALSETAPVRQFAQQFQQVIQPHGQRYANSGMTPLQIIGNLMQADQVLSQAPMPQRAQFMAKLIKDYGIDIRSLDAALAGDDPGAEPLAQVEAIINQKIAPLQEFVQTTQQTRQQAMQREYSQQERHIQAMAEDRAKYPHFDLVAMEMADIMEVAARRQVYLSPEEAYKRAVAMNPDAQAAEQSRAGQQRAQVAHAAATRSLGASLSVNGSPASLKQKVAPDDLRGTIEAAWNAVNGR